MTAQRFRQLECALRAGGYGPKIDWSERIEPPRNADDFASRAIYVICNSGMRVTVAAPIAERCLDAIRNGRPAGEVFGHAGKAAAIDAIWQQRKSLFDGYSRAIAKVDFLAGLPWIGPVTKHHLAKNLSLSAAKPDVHLMRLANREGTTPATLCRRLARLTGYKVATIDTILWRACADGILNSRMYEVEGWDAAFVAVGGQRPPSKRAPTDK